MAASIREPLYTIRIIGDSTKEIEDVDGLSSLNALRDHSEGEQDDRGIGQTNGRVSAISVFHDHRFKPKLINEGVPELLTPVRTSDAAG